MWIFFISTAVALVLGYALAYFIAARPKKSQGMWLMLIISPMFMNLTIRLYGWMILLSNEGPVTGAIRALSRTGQAPTLLFSTFSVIAGIVHYVLPFIVLNIYTSLKKLDERLAEASTMLGASRLRTFRLVIFPLSLPGVFAGGSIAFALSANTFLVPIMIGGPANGMLSNVAYNSIISIGNFGLGSAISIVLLAIVVVVCFIYPQAAGRLQDTLICFYPWYAQYLAESGIVQISARDIHRMSANAVVQRVLDACKGVEAIYLTFDIDVLEPAYAPGSGANEPGGLTPVQCFDILDQLYSRIDAMDIAEVNPLFDHQDITSSIAAKILFDCATRRVMG